MDYCGGVVLPLAIDRRVTVAAGPASGDATVFHSGLGGDDVPLAHAVVAECAAALGDVPPVEAAIESDVPIGAGLSSSAALAVAVATAVEALAGAGLDPREKARLCMRAEHAATGVPCGLMDQLTSVFGRAGHALLIDCAAEDVTPIRWPDPAVIVLLIDSGVRRALADGRYAEVRRACEADDGPGRRHVVSEIARVRAAAAALEAGRWDELGSILRAGHASLRDGLRVSCPELDLLVDLLDRPDVFGARMTGAGFGGCVVALTRASDAGAVGEEVCAAYGQRTGREGRWLTIEPADGAGVQM